jgi:hypothetical protein
MPSTIHLIGQNSDYTLFVEGTPGGAFSLKGTDGVGTVTFAATGSIMPVGMVKSHIQHPRRVGILQRRNLLPSWRRLCHYP